MNRKQLIVTSVLVMSILILVITQGFFNDNFERINTAEKETSQFTQYKLNVDDYCIVLPNEWAVKESGSDGYISCELKFTGCNDNITGIVEVINTKENIKAFAEKDVKNQSLNYSDLNVKLLDNSKMHGILNEYNTSIKGGNTYKNKCYYLSLNDEQIVKVLFNIKNTASNKSTDDILEGIISSIKDSN